MPNADNATNTGDSNYSSLLARFQLQPFRPIVPIAQEKARPRTNPRRSPVMPEDSPAPSSASGKAAKQLRSLWIVQQAMNPAFEAEGLETGEDWKQVYTGWRDACRNMHLSPLMCIEAACLGHGLDTVDARYKMRAGTAKKNMQQCLDIYCTQRGWGKDSGAR